MPTKRPGAAGIIGPRNMPIRAAPSSSPATAWSPPAIRWRRRSGSTCSSRAATRSTRPSPPTPCSGVVEPMSCGIGGDLFAIVWDAKTQKLYGLNASGRSPYNAHARGLRRARARRRFPTNGPLSWSVPGCVDGWDELRQRFGTHAASTRLLAPAIGYAEEGFPVPRGHRRLLAAAGEAAGEHRPTRPRRSCPAASAPRPGEVFKNPRPGRARYRAIADERPRRLLQGPHRQGDRRLQREERRAVLAEGLRRPHRRRGSSRSRTNYRGYDVWELPPPTARGSPPCRCSTCSKPYDLQDDGPDVGRTTGTCSSRPRSSPSPTGPRFYADPAFGKAAGRRADLEGVRRRSAAS